MGALDSIFATAAQNPAEWVLFQSDFQNTLSTAVWETVKDSGAFPSKCWLFALPNTSLL